MSEMKNFAIIDNQEDGYVMGLVAETKFDAIHMALDHVKSSDEKKFALLSKENLTYVKMIEEMDFRIVDIDNRPKKLAKVHIKLTC